MIDELQKIIKDQVSSKNKWLNRFDINSFQMDEGTVVADFNRGEVYVGPDDRAGIGAYIRYTTRIEYSPLLSSSNANKKTSSCNIQHSVRVPLRMVIYNFDSTQEFNVTKLEEKISNDLSGVNFSAHKGKETQLSIELMDSLLNSQDVWKSEIQIPITEGNNFYQMIAINFSLNFVRTFVNEECFDDCYVFNNDDKC